MIIGSGDEESYATATCIINLPTHLARTYAVKYIRWAAVDIS